MKSLLLFYLLLVLLVAARLFLFYSNQPTFADKQQVIFKTTVNTSPKSFNNYQTLWVNISPTTGALLKLPVDMQLSYGDIVLISGRLNNKLLDSGDNIFTIDYPIIEPKSSEKSPFLAVIYSIRQHIIDYFKQHLDNVSAGLLLGIVFGIKDNIPKQFLDQIQQTGVMHVVAASGMNVTMVSGFLFYFFILFLKRQIAIVAAIGGIAFYVILAGFEASIVRAAIMGSIVFGAQIIGKQKESAHILFLTVILMLFLWPEFLISIGFQLSVAATLGILFIPMLFSRFTNSFTEVFIVTISAQLATLPILIANFGAYSVLSIFTNAFVLWTIPILTILGMISAVFVFILPLFASLFLYIALPFLLFFRTVVEFFASTTAILTFSSFSWQFSLAYYFILAAAVLFFYEKIHKRSFS
ncbi:MAG: hypothetical protein A2798_03615 [Candidatus Levybacteria bacterium RIFCSPHIGHO2_01_FULL_37_17]|nr:MAG: hypothetical protein A2798_03615 [Candidatus Levybacteria bacterium RIFCSPHIGHO2_01_FULL_37_17]OGH36562.1 MAG: hypothetical protein A2959_03670 [Candidatus Levybacteria bacterium RIFCSPLOWO2_01_FULL_38_23]